MLLVARGIAEDQHGLEVRSTTMQQLSPHLTKHYVAETVKSDKDAGKMQRGGGAQRHE